MQQHEGKIAGAELALKTYLDSVRNAREALDVTRPGRRPRCGHLHPITVVRQRIEDIFVSLDDAIEDATFADLVQAVDSQAIAGL